MAPFGPLRFDTQGPPIRVRVRVRVRVGVRVRVRPLRLGSTVGLKKRFRPGWVRRWWGRRQRGGRRRP